MSASPVHLLLVSIVLVAGDARALDPVVSVFTVEAPRGVAGPAAREELTDALRGALGAALRGRAIVLTRDNTLKLLQDRGIDPARAWEAKSGLEAARVIKAASFVAATLRKHASGRFELSATLADAGSGRQIGELRVESPSLPLLAEALRIRAPELVDRPGESLAPTLLQVRSEPVAAVRIDGRFCGYTPLDRLHVTPGPHALSLAAAGYPAWSRTVEAPRGEATPVTVQLRAAFGSLNFAQAPPDARIFVDGALVSGAVHGPLSPGTYLVRVEAEGFDAFEETVPLEAAERWTLPRLVPESTQARLRRRVAAIEWRALATGPIGFGLAALLFLVVAWRVLRGRLAALRRRRPAPADRTFRVSEGPADAGLLLAEATCPKPGCGAVNRVRAGRVACVACGWPFAVDAVGIVVGGRPLKGSCPRCARTTWVPSGAGRGRCEPCRRAFTFDEATGLSASID